MKNQDVTIPLVNGKLVFNFVNKETKQKVGGGGCEIIDAKEGLATYEFKSPELEQEGVFEGSATAELSQGARRSSAVLNFEVIDKEKIPKK